MSNSSKICPTVLKYVQHIFPGGRKNFQGFLPPGYGAGYFTGKRDEKRV